MTPLIRGLEAVSSIVIVLIIAPDVARRRPPAFTLGKICPWPANPPPRAGKGSTHGRGVLSGIDFRLSRFLGVQIGEKYVPDSILLVFEQLCDGKWWFPGTCGRTFAFPSSSLLEYGFILFVYPTDGTT